MADPKTPGYRDVVKNALEETYTAPDSTRRAITLLEGYETGLLEYTKNWSYRMETHAQNLLKAIGLEKKTLEILSQNNFDIPATKEMLAGAEGIQDKDRQLRLLDRSSVKESIDTIIVLPEFLKREQKALADLSRARSEHHYPFDHFSTGYKEEEPREDADRAEIVGRLREAKPKRGPHGTKFADRVVKQWKDEHNLP